MPERAESLRRRPRLPLTAKLTALGGIGLAVLVACRDSDGGGDLRVNLPTSTQEPIVPTATFTPEPTVTVVESVIPSEAKEIFSSLDVLPDDLLNDEQYRVVKDQFEQQWQAADTPLKQYDTYIVLWDALLARYNVTRSPQIAAEMDKIQQFLYQNSEWSRYYQSDIESGRFKKSE